MQALRSKRYRWFWVLCLLLSGSLGAATADGSVTLAGTVVGPDELPVAGIAVAAGNSSDTTDEAGAFRLTGLEAGNLLLTMRGDLGEGRVKISGDDAGAPVLLTYPVTTTIILLHDNDYHFNFNHREAFEAQVNAIREQYAHVFLLNAGDLFVRHPHRWAEPEDADYYRRMCDFIISTMNEIGYDACTPGNHELCYIEDHTRAAFEAAQFPLLGANIRVETDQLPPMAPYTVLETGNGLSMAVLGLSNANCDKDGVAVDDFLETAQAHRILGDTHDLFIALTHIGLRRDRELAEALPELDVIIGGHSHDILEAGEEINGVLLGMAGGPPRQHQVDPNWPKYLGKMKLVLENDRVIEKTARVMVFEGVTEAAEDALLLETAGSRL